MPNPKLLILPARQKAGTLYGRAKDGSLVPITVNRNSDATRTNPAGLLATSPPNVCRFDSQFGNCAALLVEGQATNLLLRSEEFDNASWGKSRSTVTANTTESPSGGVNADKLVLVSGQLDAFVQQTITPAANTYTGSIYAKKGEYSTFDVMAVHLGETAATSFATVNLDLGTITNGTNRIIGRDIQNIGNGWYRVSITWTTTASVTTSAFRAYAALQATVGNGVNGTFFWGAQLETGSVATSYIPTAGNTATRLADQINLTSATSYIGQTEGAIYGKFRRGITGDGTILCVSDGTANNRIELRSQSGELRAQIVNASTTIFDSASDPLAVGEYSFCFQYGSVCRLWINGSLVSEGTPTGLVPALSRIDVGSRLSTSEFLNNRIFAIATYDAISSNEAQNLSVL